MQIVTEFNKSAAQEQYPDNASMVIVRNSYGNYGERLGVFLRHPSMVKSPCIVYFDAFKAENHNLVWDKWADISQWRYPTTGESLHIDF